MKAAAAAAATRKKKKRERCSSSSSNVVGSSSIIPRAVERVKQQKIILDVVDIVRAGGVRALESAARVFGARGLAVVGIAPDCLSGGDFAEWGGLDRAYAQPLLRAAASGLVSWVSSPEYDSIRAPGTLHDGEGSYLVRLLQRRAGLSLCTNSTHKTFLKRISSPVVRKVVKTWLAARVCRYTLTAAAAAGGGGGEDEGKQLAGGVSGGGSSGNGSGGGGGARGGKLHKANLFFTPSPGWVPPPPDEPVYRDYALAQKATAEAKENALKSGGGTSEARAAGRRGGKGGAVIKAAASPSAMHVGGGGAATTFLFKTTPPPPVNPATPSGSGGMASAIKSSSFLGGGWGGSSAGLEIASPFGPQLLAGFLGGEGEEAGGVEGEDDPLSFYASGALSLGLDEFEGGDGEDVGGTAFHIESFAMVSKLWGE